MTSAPGINVLIVDDSRPDRYLLRRDLSRTSLEVSVQESADGQEALDFLVEHTRNKSKLQHEFPPDLIFLDVNMPRVDGFTFLERFSALRREQEELRTCVIMMFSSSEHPADRERALAYDFVKGYVIKGTTSTQELHEQIKAAL